MTDRPTHPNAQPHRPRVLVVMDWFLPGEKAGGPVRTLLGLLDHLGWRGDFSIVTRDRDLGDSEPYDSVEPGRWHRVSGARCFYLRPRERALIGLLHVLRRTQYNVLYINTLFSPFALLPMAFRRLRLFRPPPLIVVAPRGQLDPGALGFKNAKKTAYLHIVRLLGLFDGVRWQATSEDERLHIRRWFGDQAEVLLAPNLRPLQRVAEPARASGAAAGAPLRVAFLSRISPKKNLTGALEILAGVRVPVEFSIYGPREDPAYWRRCEQLISRLPANVRARHCGVLPGSDVPPTLAAQDLLLLPTHGENYGHAIAEALAAGCPPLITDRTPWRGLAEAGVGWDLPLDDVQAFRSVIETCFHEPHEVRAHRAQAAMRFIERLERGSDAPALNARLLGLD